MRAALPGRMSSSGPASGTLWKLEHLVGICGGEPLTPAVNCLNLEMTAVRLKPQ